MNLDITLKEIESFKKTQLTFVRESFIKTAQLNPLITVLNYIKAENQYATIMVIVPSEYMGSTASKNLFADIVPTILEMMSKKGMIPVCLSWSSEAWIRKSSTADRTKEEIIKDYHNLPKEEAIITYFEDERGSEMNCQVVTRKGKTVDPDGNLIDEIVLSENEFVSDSNSPDKMEGRFSNLFKKYMENKEANKFRDN